MKRTVCAFASRFHLLRNASSQAVSSGSPAEKQVKQQQTACQQHHHHHHSQHVKKSTNPSPNGLRKYNQNVLEKEGKANNKNAQSGRGLAEQLTQLAKAKDLPAALDLWKSAEKSNTIDQDAINSFVAMLYCCARDKSPTVAVQFFNKLEEYLRKCSLKYYCHSKEKAPPPPPPPLAAFNHVLDAFAKSRDVPEVLEWFEKISAARLQPNERSYSSLLYVHASSGDFQRAEEVYLRMKATDAVKMDDVSYTILVQACTKRNDIARARKWIAIFTAMDFQTGRKLCCVCLGFFFAFSSLLRLRGFFKF